MSVEICRGFSSSSSGGDDDGGAGCSGAAPVEFVPLGTPLSRYPQPGNPSSPSFHRNLTPENTSKLTNTRLSRV